MAYEINFCETKEQLKHLGEVVTGKTDGSPTGADIEESTLSYTGQVRATLPELLAKIGWYSVGDWSSDPIISNDNQYVVYNGDRYVPLSTPYQVDSTPNPNPELLVGTELKLITDIKYTDLTDAQEELLPPGAKIYPPQGNLQNGQTVPAGTTHLRIEIGGDELLLAAWDELTLPATVTSIPAAGNGFNGYDIVTDQGAFEFVTTNVKYLRGKDENGFQFKESNLIGWGGIKGGIIDNAPFMDKVLEYLKGIGGGVIYTPSGEWYFGRSVIPRVTVVFKGDGGAQASANQLTKFIFADNTCGIMIHRGKSSSDIYGYNQGYSPIDLGGADGSVINGISIYRGNGSDTTTDLISHGVYLRARATIRDVVISGFAGNGLNIVASFSQTNGAFGNANNWHADNLRIQNCYHGVYTDGADVNAGVANHIDSSSNRGCGVCDSSFLGNKYSGCHFNGNGSDGDVGLDYDILTDNVNARSMFDGCYVETGGKVKLAEKSLRVGGDWAGVTDESDKKLGIYDTEAFFESLQANYLRAYVALSGDAGSVETWNQGSYSAARGSGLYCKSGLVSGDNQYTAAFVGRGGASSISSRGKAVVKIFDGTLGTPDWEDALLIEGQSNVIRPGDDNQWQLAHPSFRFTEAFVAAGTISTSDANHKTDRDGNKLVSDDGTLLNASTLTSDEISAAIEMSKEHGMYKFINAVESKGEDARLHCGITVQRAIEIMEKHNLDPFYYGFICYDEWDEEYSYEPNSAGDFVHVESGYVEFDSNEDYGENIERYSRVLIKEAGSIYSFRDNELMKFIAAGINARLEIAGI